LAEVELIVYRMSDRGRRFFDETVRLGRAFDLMNAERIRGEFERTGIADTPREVEDAVRELSDWLVERENDLWRMVSDYVERRRATSANQPGTADAPPPLRHRTHRYARLTLPAPRRFDGFLR
jgi:hypothetical protein